MLAIRIDSQYWLELNPDTAATIRMRCPLFDAERVARVFSYPFEIPATPANQLAFRHANRLDAYAPRAGYAAELYLEHMLFDAGELVISTSSAQRYKCVFRNTELSVVQQLKEQRLRDLSHIQQVHSGLTPQVVIRNIEGASTAYQAISLNGTLYDFEGTRQFPIFLQELEQDFPGLVADSEVDSGTSPPTYFLTLNLSAYPGLSITLDPAPDPNDPTGWEIHEVLLSSSDIQPLLDAYIAHAEGLKDGTGSHAFPTVKMPNLYEEENEPYIDMVNYYYPDEYVLDNPVQPDGDLRWPYTLVPMVFVRTVLDMIRDATDSLTAFAGTLLDVEELYDQLLVFNTRTLDQLIDVSSFFTDADFTDTANANVLAPSYDLADHLPDITAWEFLQKLASTFALVFSYRSGRFALDLAAQRLAFSRILDWGDKAEPAYLITHREAQAFTLDYDRQGDERRYADQLQAVDGGTGAQEFISQWYTLPTDTYPDRTGGTLRRTLHIADSDDAGTSLPLGLSNEIPAKLLLYRGRRTAQSGTDGSFYILAQHDRTGGLGQPIATYTLDWNGPGGLYEQWWKEYIQWLTRSYTVERPVRLTVGELLELRKWRNFKVHIYDNQGQVTGLVEELEIKAGLQGISLARAKIRILKTTTDEQ